MNRRTFLPIALAAILSACAPRKAQAPQVSAGPATAEEILAAAQSGIVPDRFTSAEREAVRKMQP